MVKKKITPMAENQLPNCSPENLTQKILPKGTVLHRIQQSQLISIGKALYGERWQTDLARDLGFSDGRPIRQWLAGERSIPDRVWAELAHLLYARNQAISGLLSDLYGITESDN